MILMRRWFLPRAHWLLCCASAQAGGWSTKTTRRRYSYAFADMRIDGKTALITGGSSGLGAAAAQMIVNAGGRAVVADIKAGSGAGVFIPTDVTKPDQMQSAIERC